MRGRSSELHPQLLLRSILNLMNIYAQHTSVLYTRQYLSPRSSDLHVAHALEYMHETSLRKCILFNSYSHGISRSFGAVRATKTELRIALLLLTDALAADVEAIGLGL